MAKHQDTTLPPRDQMTPRVISLPSPRATTSVGIDRRRFLPEGDIRRCRSRTKPGRVLVISRDLALWRGRGGSVGGTQTVDSNDKPAA
jgi:hypothetical protein